MQRILLLISMIFLINIAVLNAQSVVLQNEKGESIQLYNKSYALVIGVSNYTNGWPTLTGVMKDVSDVKSVLESQGFQVVTVLDPKHEELINAYRDFINHYGLDPENRLIIYFAGHGHTIKATYGEEMGYIVPADAPNPNKDKNDFLTKAMAMQQIEVFAKQIQSKHALFLFDACFSGSIFAVSRAIPENISYKTAKPVRQFITSGSADETVPDESIFKSQFVDGIEGEADVNKDGYVTGTELGEFLQEKVVNYSKGSQHPQYGKIRNPNLDKGDFVFISPNTVNSELTAMKTVNTESSAMNRSVESIPVKKENKQVLTHNYKIITDESFENSIKDMPELFAKVAFKTPNGSFLTAEQGGGNGVVAVIKDINFWETFKVISLEEGKVALKTYNGHYLVPSENDEYLTANAETLNDKTSFEILPLEDSNVALKTYNGNYLCALSGGGRQIVPSKFVKEHEIFKLCPVRNYRIKSFNGLYASIDDDKLTATCKKPDDAQVLEFLKVDKDKIVMRNQDGFYLKINTKGSFINSKELTEECVFIPEVLPNGFVRFKTLNGKYVTAIGGGGFMYRADKTSPGDWETFELLPTFSLNDK